MTTAAAAEAEPEADADAAAPRRRGPYASDSMRARRRRLLDAAKLMIAEGGAEGFTIRELSQRAKVSITTIYATYGDKESLIAAAISDYYDQLAIASAPAPRTLAEALASSDAARAAVMANKAYARQYTELFFSGTADPKVYAAVLDTITASGGLLQWLESVRARGDMLDGLSPEVVRVMLANSRLSVLHDWVQGRLSDEDLAVWGTRTFLLFARSVARGETLAEIDAELARRLAAEARAAKT
jgi:AcrR family transcriptional regulator